MTTIIDPAGTPTVVYNKSGKNIQFLSVSQGGGIVDIERVSGETVCVATATGNPSSSTDGVRLPASSDIGDVVEVYNISASSVVVPVHTPLGETIAGTVFTTVGSPQTNGIRLVKITSDSWAVQR